MAGCAGGTPGGMLCVGLGRTTELPKCSVPAFASIGYLPEHADLAQHLALVVNELPTAGALPPNGRAAELGSTYI